MLLGVIGLDIDLTIVGEINRYLKSFCKKIKLIIKIISILVIVKLIIYKNNDILLMVSKYEGLVCQ